MLLLCLALIGQPIPPDSWVYPVLDRLETEGAVSLPNTRPYDRQEVAEKIKDLKLSGIESVYIEELKEELSPEINYSVKKRLVPRPFVFQTAGGHLGLAPDIFFDYDNLPRSRAGADLAGWGVLPPVDFSGKIKISHFFAGFDSFAVDGKAWRGTTIFEIQSAILSFTGGMNRNFTFALGKSPFFYGPAQFGGLILSPNPFGLDIVNANVHAGDFYFTTFFSILEPGRYLSSHRLDVVKPHFKLGFTEMILYARTIEFEYLIPLVPYYAVQWLKNRDDNIMWAIDGSLLLKHVKFYGELLIDDLMYDQNTRAPNKLGFTVGLKLADPLNLPGVDLVLEYTRIDKWVYTQRDSLNRFVRNLVTDRPLGDSIGPDADMLGFEVSHRFSYLVAVDAALSFRRQGEGRIDRSFEQEGGSPNPPFPSGTVETQIEPSLGLDIRPHWCFEIKPRIGYQWIKNRSNVAGDNSHGLKVALSAQINF